MKNPRCAEGGPGIGISHATAEAYRDAYWRAAGIIIPTYADLGIALDGFITYYNGSPNYVCNYCGSGEGRRHYPEREWCCPYMDANGTFHLSDAAITALRASDKHNKLANEWGQLDTELKHLPKPKRFLFLPPSREAAQEHRQKQLALEDKLAKVSAAAKRALNAYSRARERAEEYHAREGWRNHPRPVRKAVNANGATPCPYCLQPYRFKHTDHIVPFIMGGSDEYHNLIDVCESCNLKKKAKPLRDFCRAERLDYDRICAHLRTLGKTVDNSAPKNGKPS